MMMCTVKGASTTCHCYCCAAVAQYLLNCVNSIYWPSDCCLTVFCVHMSVCTGVSVRVCTCMYVSVCTDVCVCVQVSVYMCVCVRVYRCLCVNQI